MRLSIKWHSSSVIVFWIVRYISEFGNRKTRTASYKGIGLHPVDKEKEWHIVENAHEAIILKILKSCRKKETGTRKDEIMQWLVQNRCGQSVGITLQAWCFASAT